MAFSRDVTFAEDTYLALAGDLTPIGDVPLTRDLMLTEDLGADTGDLTVSGDLVDTRDVTPRRYPYLTPTRDVTSTGDVKLIKGLIFTGDLT